MNCRYVGQVAFNKFVLPCVEELVEDPVEPVIHATVSVAALSDIETPHCTHLYRPIQLRTLAVLTGVGSIPTDKVVNLVSRTAPLLLHPGRWVRAGAEAFV